MREILQTLIIIILTTNTLFANALKDTSDYKYYFYVGEELKDIRGFKAVDRKVLPKGEVRFYPAQDRMLIKPHKGSSFKNTLYINRLNGTSVNQLVGWFTPNWKYKYKFKEGDLWAADINWETGNISNERQLTELGIFAKGNSYSLRAFYGSKIYFTHFSDGKHNGYLLDIESKEMIEAPKDIKGFIEVGWNLDDSYFSPNKQYLVPKGNTDIKAYDLKTEKLLSIPFTRNTDSYTRIWINNHTLAQITYEKQDSYIEIANLKTQGFNSTLIATNDEGRARISAEMRAISGQRSFTVSPDGTKFLYHTEDKLYIFDIKQDKRILCEENFKESLPNAFNHKYLIFKWLSNEKLIYAKKGNLLNQGTWIYDVKNQTKKRITPYIAKDLIVLRKAKKVVFNSNDEFYSCNTDGSNLEKVVLPRMYSNELKPFLTN